MITYEQLAAWHDQYNMHMHQNFYEFCAWLNLCESIQPRFYLEIGTYRFGTAEMALAALPTLEKLVTVDIQDRLAEESEEKQEQMQKDWGNRLRLILSDSMHFGPEAYIRHILNERRIGKNVEIELYDTFDCLFIDGIHTYEGVANDFIRYGSLVRPGGLIGFHDVIMKMTDYGPAEVHGSVAFFKELSRLRPERCEYIKTDPGPWGNYGIGVYRKPVDRDWSLP